MSLREKLDAASREAHALQRLAQRLEGATASSAHVMAAHLLVFGKRLDREMRDARGAEDATITIHRDDEGAISYTLSYRTKSVTGTDPGEVLSRLLGEE